MPNQSYVRTFFPPIISRNLKDYQITVRDLPSHEKPREKLIEQGGESLSLQELLSVLLNVGTKKEGILEMSSRIIREYGEKNIITEKNPQRLSEMLSIPLIKATQLVAAIELGRRLFDRSPHTAPVIRNAQDVFDYAEGMRSLSKEYLRGIYLNTHYKVMHDEIISIGTIDASIVHPREVFKPAIERSAVGVVLVHNHPSGELEISEQDVAVTLQLQKAGALLGIELLDHVIVSSYGFISILEYIKDQHNNLT
jgi:DNA repair protein RadC